MKATMPGSALALWFPLIGAPAAWTIQGLIGWWSGERLCSAMSIATVRGLTVVVTLAALAVAVGGIVIASKMWQRSSPASHPMHTDATGRVEFMALGGVLVSSAFAIGIVWAGLSSVFLNACGRVR
jgi:hypothetical protein